MKRREFITLLGGAAVTWPFAARGQQPKMSVIGYLGPGSAAASASTLAVFRQNLAGAGYVEGRNIAIEYRFAEGRYDRLPEMAAELVRQQVSLIVATGGTAPALAAKAATATLPIVFSVTDDPVALGLVVSFARPGGNATGVNFPLAELAAKQLGLLHELVPAARRIGLLVNPNNSPSEAVSAAAPSASRTYICFRSTRGGATASHKSFQHSRGCRHKPHIKQQSVEPIVHAPISRQMHGRHGISPLIELG